MFQVKKIEERKVEDKRLKLQETTKDTSDQANKQQISDNKKLVV